MQFPQMNKSKSMKPDIKLVALDIDGTLLNSQHDLTPRTRDALQKVKQAGIPIILATGRSRNEAAVKIINDLALTTPGIFLQGIMVHNADGSVRHEHALSQDIIDACLALAQAKGYSPVAYCGTRMLVKQRNQYTDWVINFREAPPEELGDWKRFPADLKINKLVFYDDAERIPAIRAQLNAVLGNRVSMVQSLVEAVEILPKGISKGWALAQLIGEFGVRRDQVLACGDAENDVEMIQFAGIGVAMGNAMPLAKQAADYITASNDEDGVALALEKFVLNGH